jgi:hypothetical protein
MTKRASSTNSLGSLIQQPVGVLVRLSAAREPCSSPTECPYPKADFQTAELFPVVLLLDPAKWLWDFAHGSGQTTASTNETLLNPYNLSVNSDCSIRSKGAQELYCQRAVFVNKRALPSLLEKNPFL